MPVFNSHVPYVKPRIFELIIGINSRLNCINSIEQIHNPLNEQIYEKQDI
jgi:hypothetical protein